MGKFLCSVIFALFVMQSSFSRAAKADDYFHQFYPSISKVEHLMVDYVHQILPEYGGVNAEISRINLYQLLDSLSNEWAGVKSFKKGDTFKDSVYSALIVARDRVRDIGGELMDLESSAYKTTEGMDAYLDGKKSLSTQLVTSIEKMNAAMERFAKKFELEQDISALNEQMQKLNEFKAVYFNYYCFYSVFFDANVKEGNLIAWIVNGNITQAEKGNVLLLNAVKNGLARLNELFDYRDDKLLKVACEQLLSFYKYEAKEEFPSIIAYGVLAKEFNAFELSYLAKPLADRGENETKTYLLRKEEFEKASEIYEITIERTNLFRTDRLTVWQDASQDFLVKYLPR